MEAVGLLYALGKRNKNYLTILLYS